MASQAASSCGLQASACTGGGLFDPTPTGSEFEWDDPARPGAPQNVHAGIAEDRSWIHVALGEVMPINPLPPADTTSGKNNKPGKQQREHNKHMLWNLQELEGRIDEKVAVKDFQQLKGEVNKKALAEDIQQLQTRVDENVAVQDFQRLENEVKKMAMAEDIQQLQARVAEVAAVQDNWRLENEAHKEAMVENIQQLQDKVDEEVAVQDFQRLEVEVNKKAMVEDIEQLQAEMGKKAEIQNLEVLQSVVAKFASRLQQLEKCMIGLSIVVVLLLLVSPWDMTPPLWEIRLPLDGKDCNASSSFTAAVFPADRSQNTALCLAARSGDVELVKAYLRNLNAATTNFECFHGAALINAIEFNQTEVASLMINDESVDVNVIGENGNSALHIALVEGNLEIARALLNRSDFALINHANIGGFSPLGKLSQFFPPAYPWSAIARAIMEDRRFVADPDEMLDMFGEQ